MDFGQSLKGVCYRINNRRNIKLHYRLNVSIHNASDTSCPKIIDIAFLEDVVKKLSWRQWQDILDRVANREDQRIFEWIRKKNDKIREDDWREFEKGLYLFLKSKDTSVFSDEELFNIYDSIYAMAIYWRIAFAQFSKDFPKSAKIKTKGRRSKKYQEVSFKLKKELRKPLDNDIFAAAFEQAMS